MYVPTHFAADAAAVRELLHRPQAADLITMTDEGMLATFLPYLFDRSEAGCSPRSACSLPLAV